MNPNPDSGYICAYNGPKHLKIKTVKAAIIRDEFGVQVAGCRDIEIQGSGCCGLWGSGRRGWGCGFRAWGSSDLSD